MKTTPALQPVIMFLSSLNKVFFFKKKKKKKISSSSSSSSLSSSLLSYFSLLYDLSFSCYITFPLTVMVVFSVLFEDYWISLSDEIILAIFQLLPKKAIVKCARVCKHWHRLA